MYLKRIELKGFKSFADKTTIEFDNNITCVVGPNGSGKSNITDAFRWVLGEQKYKNLRGTQMQDVIFNGTKTRNPLGYAEVVVVFDNRDKFLPLEYSEVSISRRLFRSGESEYFINKNSCRLKDIKELIMDTGIGVEGYSIIAQGRIDQLLSSSKGERRLIFDEAAGIVKHKNSKEEALKKLERSNSNLERVNDIINELEANVVKLESESKSAKIYKELSHELFQLEINIYIKDIEEIEKSLKIVVSELNNLSFEMANQTSYLEQVQDKHEKIKQKIETLDMSIRSFEKKLNDIKAEDVSLIHSIEMLLQKKTMISQNLKNLENDFVRQSDISNEMMKEIQKLEKKSGDIDVESVETKILSEDEIAEKEDRIDELNVVDRYILLMSKKDINHRKIEELNKKSSDISKKIDDENLDLTLLDNKIYETNQNLNNSRANRDILKEQEESNEGYSYATKKVLQSAKDDKFVYGIVKDLFKVDEKFETAIEIIIGRGIQNIVVEDKSVVGKYIDELKKSKSGRATFLPIRDIKVRSENLPNLFDGYYGSALSLIQYNKYFEPAMYYMFRNIYIVENLDCAYKLAKLLKVGNRIVTIQGEIMNVGGSISGGSISKNSHGLLKRVRRIKKFEFDVQRYSVELSKHMADKKMFQRKIDDYKILQKDISFNLQNLLEKRGEIIGQIEQISINISSVKTQKMELYKAIVEEIEFKKNQIFQMNLQIQDIENTVKEENYKRDKVNSSLGEIHSNIQEENNKKIELKSKMQKLSKEIEILRLKYNEFNERISNLNIEKTRFETRKEATLQSLWDKYEMSFVQAEDKIESLGALPKDLDWNKRVKAIKNDLKKIGSVNLNSIEEYEIINERYQFLVSQREDILSSIEKTSKIIFDIDKDMKENFLKYFVKIQENFNEVFTSLFGGGSTDIELSNPDDVLASEVNIIVQPPGKKLQSMELMSGGEKALTAIALLFGILKTKPSPFCILDEIEASLDDLNVYRFSEFLKNYNKSSQFVIITHRRGTMEIAEALYGVTMQEKGVSKIISKKLGELEE